MTACDVEGYDPPPAHQSILQQDSKLALNVWLEL